MTTKHKRKTDRPVGVSKKQVRKQKTFYRTLLKRQTKLLKEQDDNEKIRNLERERESKELLT